MLQAAVLALGSTGQARAQAMVVESSGGPVTKTEREAFKAFMLTRVPPPNAWGDTGQHNALADGTAGTDVEAMGQMFEATGDVEILDRMIFFLDEFVALRNDLPGGAHRVVWTGKVEKVWLGAVDTVAPGGENSDTIAHIAYGALLILRAPALWPRVVPDGNPHGYGATYLERAKTYVARTEEANDEYVVKSFVQPGTNLIRNPPGWPPGAHTMEAINIQMMLDGGFQRDAEIHALLGTDPQRVARYDAIVKTTVRECLDGMKHASQAAGRTVYVWYYYPWDVRHVETVGHAQYDILGIWRAAQRSAYGLKREELMPLADTLSYVISLGNNSFATVVDGTGPPRNVAPPYWLLASDWNDSAYDIMAGAVVASGVYRRSPAFTAMLLWTKARRAAAGPPGPGGGDGGREGVPDAGTVDVRPDAAQTEGPAPADAARVAAADASLRPPAEGDVYGDARVVPSSTASSHGGCASCRIGARKDQAAWASPAMVALLLVALSRRRQPRR